MDYPPNQGVERLRACYHATHSSRMKLFPHVLIAVLLAFNATAHAFEIEAVRAQYTVTSWTEKDGMPSSYVRAIAQDRDGYLWLATYSGLLRFDGVRFVTRRSADGSSLPSDDLSAILIARDGSMWIGGVVGGVTHLSAERSANDRSSADGLFGGYVFMLLEDDSGAIWAAAQGGLARFNGTHWERFGPDQGLPRRPALSVHQDTRGTLWVGTSAGMYRGTRPYAHFEAVPSLPYSIEAIAADAAGNVVATHPTRLFSRLTGPPVTTANPTMRAVHGTRLVHDRNGHLWVGTRGQGITRARTSHGSPREVIEHITQQDGLSSNSVLALFEDREGNIWVGTPFGLNRLSRNSVIPVPMAEGVGGHVRAITAAEDGSVWAATAETVIHFSGSRQTLHQASGMAAATINALHRDREKGVLWISTDRGVVRYDSGGFNTFSLPGGPLLTRVRSITTDTAGRLWLCDGDRGVFRSRDSRLSAFDVVSDDIPASSVYASRDGSVWIGFVNGTLRRFNGEKVESFSEEDGLPRGGTVTAIYEDASGTTWVGTHRGLSRFERGKFITLSRTDGFPGPGPVAIVDDGRENLWLGVTGLGVLRITRKDFDRAATERSALRYRLYAEADGLRATPVRWLGTPTSARASDGSLWFLTGNGLAVLNPNTLREAEEPVPLRIEGIFADDKEIRALDNASLPPNTSTLQVEYTLASLAPFTRVRFRYKLEGLDAHWIDAGARRQAFYTNVPPGRYRFVVEASTDGMSRSATAVWPFSIQPRFYQTPWFAIACVAGAGVALWGLWHLRLRQVQRGFAAVLDERARMGREIHDTLLQGLVGVAMQFKIIGEHVHTSPDLAKDRLERLRKLVEHYIGETRQSIWDLRSPALESADLVTALKTAGETITSDKGVRFAMTVTGRLSNWPPKVEEHLLRIACEAVSNAVRHAKPTCVRLDMAFQEDRVTLCVTDDGSGFNVDDRTFANAPHWGLASMRERAQQINGNLHITSAPGRGTELILSVPAGKAKTLWVNH